MEASLLESGTVIGCFAVSGRWYLLVEIVKLVRNYCIGIKSFVGAGNLGYFVVDIDCSTYFASLVKDCQPQGLFVATGCFND